MALAVAGAMVSSHVSAEYFDSPLKTPNISGQDEIVVGSAENRIENSVSVTNKDGIGLIDTNDGGKILLYGNDSAIYVSGQNSSLTIGSSKTSELSIDVLTDKLSKAVYVLYGELQLDAKNITIGAHSENSASYGLWNSGGVVVVGEQSGEGSKVLITATSASTTGKAFGIVGGPNIPTYTSINAEDIEVVSSDYAVSIGKGELNIGSDITKKLILTSTGTEGEVVLLHSQSVSNLKGDVISISGGSAAVKLQNGSKASVWGNQVNISSGDDAGIIVIESDLEIDTDVLNIFSSEGDGIAVQGNSKDSNTSVRIDSGKTTIVADHGAGIMATSYGQIDIKGDLSVTASDVIAARGYAVVNINQEGGHTVVLDGDIVFAAGNDSNSGKDINADVNVRLSGSSSSWTGGLLCLEDEGEESQTLMKGLDLVLEKGATWNATVYKGAIPEDGRLSSPALEKLQLEGGVVNATEVGQTIAVNNLVLKNSGAVFNALAQQAEGGSLTTSKLLVSNVQAEEGGAMTVNYTGITSDQVTTRNEGDLNAFVAQGVEINETVQEGDINGVWERQTLADGTSTVTRGANTKLVDYNAANAMSLVQWRNEINHLTKRLGDIRASEGSIGAWARVYGGESKWGSADQVEMNHTTIQVGSDYRLNNHWIAGGAFSYTNSSADLQNGQADGDSYSLAAYATYTADGGSFLDLIARYGYLKNDITAGNMALDTSSSAFSLSAEMGHTFRFIEDRAYVEPQIEFTYGFIGGDDKTASNGIHINQDDFQSFVTRVGVRAGYDFPEKKGSFYGMLSYSYDWLGDADGMASKEDLRQALSEDLGGGWVTYGIGAQFMMGDNAYVYGELERTAGGDIDNPYLFSAGVRLTF